MNKLKKIIDLGILEDTDPWLAGKIRLVNIMCLSNYIMIVSFILLDLLISHTHPLSLITAVICLTMLIPYYLNYKQRYISARVAFLTLAYICICGLAVVFGEAFYFQYYLVPGVGMSLIFFRNEIGWKKWIFSVAGIPLWILLEVWFSNHPPLIVLAGAYTSVLSYFSSFLIFITAITMFAVFTHENDKQLEHINKMNEKLKDMSNKDALTGLYNRRFIDQYLSSFFNQGEPKHTHFSVIIFDIDHFKKINDTYGHDAGDQVLKRIATLSNDLFKEPDLIGRIGGEEFCLLLINADKKTTINKVENFRIVIEKEVVHYEESILSVTASFGIAYCTNEITNHNDLQKQADDALYQAKKAGRNCVIEYDT
jgi:diguanylate cyclase (GGDEF)-like protein